MKILAFNPFHGGSHKDCLENWQKHSRHDWKVLALSPHHWKWRMRQAPLHFSELCKEESLPDLLFCTSMFNLCEFKGLCSKFSQVPSVMYFHENQLTYPVEEETQRDYHLAFSQFSAALVADEVWFNSEYHLNQYLEALYDWLKRMPGPSLMKSFEKLKEQCQVHYPGIELKDDVIQKSDQPCLNLLWSARWEEDKNPSLFLDLLETLERKDFPFQVTVTGCKKEVALEDFKKRELNLEKIDVAGFVSKQELNHIFKNSDVFISTAHHEYFGLSALQAAAHGCGLLLPNRCVYPEIYESHFSSVVYHDDRSELMLDQLQRFLELKLTNGLIDHGLISWIRKFEVQHLTQEMDKKLEQICR